MTKTLEQIQKENRKFILEAIHSCSYDEALKKEIGLGCDIVVQNYVCGVKDKTIIITLDKSIRICDLTGLFVFANNNKPLEIIEIIGKPITLNRVLLALPKINKENKTLDFLIAERGWEEIGGKWFDGYKKCFIARVETIFSCDCCEDFWSDVFVWDLELETLEQQSEETQKEINKIFIGE